MRSEKEILKELNFLIQKRRKYLKERGTTDYTKKLWHYIQVLEWVLERRERTPPFFFYVGYEKPEK